MIRITFKITIWKDYSDFSGKLIISFNVLILNE
jgi:hypothetical protein